MIIPQKIYRQIEGVLRQRDRLLGEAQERLQDARDRAYSATAPAVDTDHVSSGVSYDRLERAAISVVEAEDAVRRASRWGQVFLRLDEAFEGTRAGDAAKLLYSDGLTQAQMAARLQIDRQTARRLQDKYVTNAALFAAAAGLISVGGTPWE